MFVYMQFIEGLALVPYFSHFSAEFDRFEVVCYFLCPHVENVYLPEGRNLFTRVSL